jgi:hypothetical protein
VEPFIVLLLQILVFAIVFAVLYWIVGLIASLLPAPIGNVVRVLCLVILGLLALSFLLGEFGIWGDWGWSHPRWHRR